MRQQYTQIFKSTLSSRVWAQPPAVRCVWFWMQLFADPEGFVATDMAGVALGANVTLADARAAMDVFEGPDADADPSDPNEGRVVKRVKGGWLIIDFEAARERAKLEAEKARKRRGMQRARQLAKLAAQGVDKPVDAPAANDVIPVGGHGTIAHIATATVPTCGESTPEVDANSKNVDQPKPTPTPIPKPHSSEGVGSPLPPTASSFDAAIAFDAPVVPAVLHRLPESWQPSQALRDEARIAGVHRFDEHIARLRLGPIGGQRGVFPDQLDHWVRSLFGKMRTWDEIERAKNPPGAKPPAAMPSAQSVPGAPPWVLVTHREFCQQRGLKLGEQAKAFAKGYHLPVDALHPPKVAEAFTHWLLTNAAGEAA